MAESTDLGEMLIQIRADVKGLQASLNQGKKEVEGFAKYTSGAIGELGKTLIGVFSLAKIGSFVKGSIEEFAQFEKAMSKLSKVVNGFGGDWKNLKAGVNEFAQELEATTKFQDDEVVDTLTKVTFKVKDLGIAMGITKQATKLASLTGQDLETTADTLALAYQGNERGLMMLAKSMGIAGKQAKDVGFLFAELEKRTSAVSGEAETLMTGWNQFNKVFKNIMQDVGEALAPAAKWFMTLVREWIPSAWKMLKGFGIAWTGIFLDIASRVKEASAQFMAFIHLLGNLRHPIDAWKEYQEDRARIAKEYEADLIVNAQTTQREFDKLYAADVAHYDAASADKIAKGAARNKAALDSQKFNEEKFLADQLREQQKANEIRQKMRDDDMAKLTEEREKDKAEAKAHSDAVAKFSEDMSTAFFTAAQAGQDAFKALGKAMVKSIVNAIAEILDKKATAAFLQGTLNLASENYAGAAKEYAAGTAVAAAAGAMRAAATAYLAEGGIVTKPTRAIIGEGGEPEAVIPLSKMGQFGMGGATINGGIAINLPSVKNPDDFANPESRRTIQRVLAETLQQMQDRKGLRLQNGIA